MLDELGPMGSTHEKEQVTFNRKKITVVGRRVIVKLAQQEDDAALDTAVDAVLSIAEGAQVARGLGMTGRMILLVPEGDSVAQWSKKLSAVDQVEYAEPDVIDQAQIVPNDPRYPNQWALPLVNAEAAWDLETGAANALIGIIDSGISMTAGVLDHDDLSTPGRITLGTDFVDGGTPRDLNGHGTHVAGIAAAAGQNSAGIAGMNWDSPVYVCRTLDAAGSGSSADFADAVEEITDYAVANGLKAVINYSGGGAHNQTKRNACQYASDNGMLLVAATGNDNHGPVIWPAAYSTSIAGVVAVGSTDANDTVSTFSNVGPEVTVVAPGRNILSTTPTYVVRPGLPVNYGTMSGTSMATPLVSGLAALMWSRHPAFTNSKVKQCLQDTAVELGTGNFNNNWGYGRVDALAAVKCGDYTIPVTKIGPRCPTTRIVPWCPKTRLFVECAPKTILCPRTHLMAYCPTPSKLPNLCPNTKLSLCWSHLLCVEPTTRLGCPALKTRICPSAVDACPSAPGGCFGHVPDPFIGRRIGNVFDLRFDDREVWYGTSTGDLAAEDEAGWFYVDDDGEIHEV